VFIRGQKNNKLQLRPHQKVFSRVKIIVNDSSGPTSSRPLDGVPSGPNHGGHNNIFYSSDDFSTISSFTYTSPKLYDGEQHEWVDMNGLITNIRILELIEALVSRFRRTTV
jgi:hypothetical protein